MLDDFTPIIHRLAGRTIRIWAIADVHIGAREADIKGFKKFLEEKVTPDPDAFIVICGDLINNGLRSSTCPTNIYHETMSPRSQIEYAVKLLEPVADKILGCVGGNHEHRSVKAVDYDPLFQIMTLLGKPELYRSNFAFVRVALENGNTRDNYALMLVHGKTMNKQKWFSYSIEGIDAIIGGHLHQGNVAKNGKLVFTTSNNVKIRPFVNMTATSWLKFGGYAARELMMPSATSDPQCLVLEFANTNSRKGRISVSW